MKIYRIPFWGALLISVLPIGWILYLIVNSYSSYVTITRFGGYGLENAPPFTSELMRFFIRDQFNRIRLRMSAPSMPVDSTLPLVELFVGAGSQERLNSNLPASGKSQHYPAYLKWEGEFHRVNARYVGDNHWHWLYEQKSWRIKSVKSQLINGAREFNLKNPRTRIAFNEAISMELAASVGLIAPRVFPIRLMLNGEFHGVYLWQDVIDETVLKRAGRSLGSLYDGDGASRNATTGVSALWEDEVWWRKDIWQDSKSQFDRTEIRELIAQINEDSLLSFYEFATRKLHQDHYTTFVSLDNILAGGHHDFNHNHKLYFDPGTGRMEPVAWDTDAWQFRNVWLDCAHNPLLVNWKLVPQLDHLRLKKLYSLIVDGPLTEENVIRRISEYDLRIRESLEADFRKDYKYWNGLEFLKFKVYPMLVYGIDAYVEQVDYYREGVRKRFRFLRDYLDDCSVRYQVSRSSGETLLTVASAGKVAAELGRIRIKGTFDEIHVYRDRNLNGRLDDTDELLTPTRSELGTAIVSLSDLIYPGYKKEGLSPHRSQFLFGAYDYLSSPLPFTYILSVAQGAIEKVELDCNNVLTGVPAEVQETVLTEDLFEATVSLHPWAIPGRAN